ncbi:MAG TPA: hypothetical protein VFE45_00730 [Coriobacteriia bacterium]|nr:hypothetical protein [Coriobacteriia bacterium]
MTPATWIALLGGVLTLAGVWLGSWLTTKATRDQRLHDAHQEAFARYLAGCAAWEALAQHHFAPARFIRPSDEALADAAPALQVLWLIAPSVAKDADGYLASLQILADYTSPNFPEWNDDLQAILDRTTERLPRVKSALLEAMRADLVTGGVSPR